MLSEHIVIAGILTVFVFVGVFTVWLACDLAIDLYRRIRDYIDTNM